MNYDQQQNNNNGGISSSSSFCHFHPTQLITAGICPFCLNERLIIIAEKQRTETGGHSRRPCYTATIHGSGDGGFKKRNHLPPNRSYNNSSYSTAVSNKSKIFALGSLLLTFRGHHHQQEEEEKGSCKEVDHDSYRTASGENEVDNDDLSTSSSLEDSFISIRFEDNGTASWENNNNNKKKSGSNITTTDQQLPNSSSSKQYQLHHPSNNYYTKVNNSLLPLDQTTTQRGSMLRWRKRVSQLLQLVKWRTSSSSSSSSLEKTNDHSGVLVHGMMKKKKNSNKKGNNSGSWIRDLTRRNRTKRSKHQY